MNPSEHIKDFIRGFEKCRLRAYLPTNRDVWTIGWGHTGPEVHDGLEWTQEAADAAFEADVERFARGVGMAAGSATQSQHQFDALVSLAFNIGMVAFRNSTLLRKHKSHDYAGAGEEFLRWNHQAGKVLAGLTRRRKAERRMYTGEGE